MGEEEDGQNWFLIVVAIVGTCLVFAINVYVLVNFQHPDDRNQVRINVVA